MKKKIIIISMLIIFICATIFSIYKFSVINPISSCFGMLQILFTNKEYTVVQKFPKKVIFAKPSYSLYEYMENRGFKFVPEDQVGSHLVFSNGTEGEGIYSCTNGYYSKWIWE